jgi:hypothetical protein
MARKLGYLQHSTCSSHIDAKVARPPNAFAIPTISRCTSTKRFEAVCRVEAREGGQSFIYSSTPSTFFLFFFLLEPSLVNDEVGVLVWWTMNRV